MKPFLPELRITYTEVSFLQVWLPSLQFQSSTTFRLNSGTLIPEMVAAVRVAVRVEVGVEEVVGDAEGVEGW